MKCPYCSQPLGRLRRWLNQLEANHSRRARKTTSGHDVPPDGPTGIPATHTSTRIR